MLMQTSRLDQEQLTALDLLCADCKRTDGNGVAIYRHLLGADRVRPSNILFYQETLVGYLGAFFFHEDACEIAIMVAPAHRRQGIASQLLTAILPLIKVEGIQRLVFSSPHELHDSWLSAASFHYQGSEFQMQRSGNAPIAIQNASACMRVATEADIPVLCAIDNACFTTHKPDMPARLLTLLNDPSHCLFVICQNNEIMGKAHLDWQSNGARLSDVAIIPSAQGRGLGTAMLAHCINHALAINKPDIVLDVETTNKQALRLYTRLGFTISNAHDYWCIDEIGLTGFLHHL